jgi:hypothetical protein
MLAPRGIRFSQSIPTPNGAPLAYFYEIRSADNAVLKRDGGFATQDAAKIAGREDAKKMKNMRQPDRPDVGRILVGQNAEKATRY